MNKFLAYRRKSRILPIALIAVAVVCALLIVACSDNSSNPAATKNPLAGVTSLTAYSASATSLGLNWTASANASLSDYASIQVNVKTGSNLDSTYTLGPSAVSAIISNLTEGTTYTFEVIGVASSSSTAYSNSNPTTIQWAPARRLTSEQSAPVDVGEIASPNLGSGLQFYGATSGGPRVLSIGANAGYQQTIDVLLDTTSAGAVIMESAYLNPLLLSGVARDTKFSSTIRDADTLDDAQSAPPASTTYTSSSVTIPTSATGGKIFYAVTSDTHYVRIFLKPNGSSFFFGSKPNRRIRVELSYQGVAGVLFAKPDGN